MRVHTHAGWRSDRGHARGWGNRPAQCLRARAGAGCNRHVGGGRQHLEAVCLWGLAWPGLAQLLWPSEQVGQSAGDSLGLLASTCADDGLRAGVETLEAGCAPALQALHHHTGPHARG